MSELDDGQRAAVVTALVTAAVEPSRAGREVATTAREPDAIRFNRPELQTILSLYGRMVALGEWRDYAIDHLRERAVFSVFRRSGESAFYRIEKAPKLAGRQGQYCVMAQSGLILKRGNDLARVIAVMEKRPKLAAV